ncbi:hypothetical protein V6N12_044990 [Hibiscus sabdariffa]|uniref:Uncharacterized protein n=1 Tax=Hibiscus sabdariffa TaxID=183260 RepID=A0ABR2G1G1_9ROSI
MLNPVADGYASRKMEKDNPFSTICIVSKVDLILNVAEWPEIPGHDFQVQRRRKVGREPAPLRYPNKQLLLHPELPKPYRLTLSLSLLLAFCSLNRI